MLQHKHQLFDNVLFINVKNLKIFQEGLSTGPRLAAQSSDRKSFPWHFAITPLS